MLLSPLLSNALLAVALLAAELYQSASTHAAPQGATAIVFGQEGCPPCARIKRVVDELRREGHSVAYFDIKDVPGAVDTYDIRVTPTTFFTRDMVVVRRVEGYIPTQQFRAWLLE